MTLSLKKIKWVCAKKRAQIMLRRVSQSALLLWLCALRGPAKHDLDLLFCVHKFAGINLFRGSATSQEHATDTKFSYLKSCDSAPLRLGLYYLVYMIYKLGCCPLLPAVLVHGQTEYLQQLAVLLDTNITLLQTRVE